MVSDLLSGFTLSPEKTILTLCAVGIVASFDLVRRFHDHKGAHYIFACLLGTFLSVGFLRVTPMVFTPDVSANPYWVALLVCGLAVLWRLLFGPWQTHVKATVLGVFIFWIALHIIEQKTGAERMVTYISMAFALLPAFLWAWLFLPYHREKPARIALMFFAGMAATAPILFYDALVRSGGELHFFYFRIVPESFNASTVAFISGNFGENVSLGARLSALMLSFILVAVIEEGSKFWVLRKSGEKLFSSIDDALELSIIVALGFAFAENILNSSYFPTFVRQYLIDPESRNILAFIANIAGRSVLTSMVHIVSTGIIGLALGRVIFAKAILAQDAKDHLWTPRLSKMIASVLRISPVEVFRGLTIALGFTAGVLTHTLANFSVSFPDALPGHPRTVGDLLGLADGSPFQNISLLMFPSFAYVVGGYLLLTWLLEWQRNREERGRMKTEEVFVSVENGR
jgi:hypothetical protein